MLRLEICLQVLGGADLVPHAQRLGDPACHGLICDLDYSVVRVCNLVERVGEQVEAVLLARRTAVGDLSNVSPILRSLTARSARLPRNVEVPYHHLGSPPWTGDLNARPAFPSARPVRRANSCTGDSRGHRVVRKGACTPGRVHSSVRGIAVDGVGQHAGCKSSSDKRQAAHFERKECETPETLVYPNLAAGFLDPS